MPTNSFYTAFDLTRREEENAKAEYRTAFQVDRDRVLYTPAFRQLQSKTQVFLSGEYDFYRTRLTHSLEVAQIGRAITNWLTQQSPFFSAAYYIDSDLVEAACLSHDLGHPPFGHAGEQILNELLSEAGGFEGNAQTLRLLTQRIFTQSRRGMNPTRAFADSVLKYKTLWSELGGATSPPPNHFLYDEQSGILDWVLDGHDFPVEYPPGTTRDAFRSIECQIMDWADDAAYSLNDLVDSVKTGFLSTDAVKEWARRQDLCKVEQKAITDLLRAMEAKRLDAFVGRRIGSYITSTTIEEEVNFFSATTNRYRYKLIVDPEKRAESSLYKRMLYERVFMQPTLKQLEFKGKEMLRSLWTTFEESCLLASPPTALLDEDRMEELSACSNLAKKQRLLSDYLSGLTDLSAKRLYRRMFDPAAGSITDLLT